MADKKKLPKGITQRSNGLYMGRFQYEGERYTLYDEDMDKLQTRIEDMKYELRHGIYEKEKNITVSQWFRTWIDEYKVNSVKVSTIQLYEDVYRRHIKKQIGNKKMKDIRPEHIQKIYNTLVKKGSTGVIPNIAGVLSGTFSQAYKNQIISKNPVALANVPKVKRKKDFRVMTVEEQTLFLKYCDRQIVRDMSEMALFTGMRSGELRGLEWSDIDFKNRTIHVTGTLIRSGGIVFRDLPKTAAGVRDIPMLDNVYDILKRVKKDQAKMRMMLGEKYKQRPGLENLVFTKENGGCIIDHTFALWVRAVEDRIRDDKKDFDHVYPHIFRHTFATRCIEKGMAPQVLKTILGHSKLTMTMDLYAHVLPDTKVEEMQKIANLF